MYNDFFKYQSMVLTTAMIQIISIVPIVVAEFAFDIYCGFFSFFRL